MSSSSGSKSGGAGILTILFVVFLVLKLTDQIDWSWWWVTAPLWGPFALLAAIGLLIGIAYFGIGFLERRRRNRERQTQQILEEFEKIFESRNRGQSGPEQEEQEEQEQEQEEEQNGRLIDLE